MKKRLSKRFNELVTRLMDDFGYDEVEATKIAYEKVYGD